MKNQEYGVIVLSLVFIVLTLQLIMTSIDHNKAVKTIKNQHSTIQSLTSEVMDKNLEIHKLQSYIETLEEDIQYYQKLTNIKEYLRGYSVEEQALGLALCFTESSWNPEANHQGLYSNICGNKPHWSPYLEELGIETNSIEAGIAIYKFYKQKNKGSRFLAIKEYKGIKSQKNHYLVHNTLELREIILKKLKDESITKQTIRRGK